MTPPTASSDQSYADLRAQMVVYLTKTTGDARTPAVIDALSAVPRQLVIDDTDPVDPADTYDPEGIVVTKTDTDGNTISSVSAARIQTIQLEQADLHPGHRVLEIGSGGVNAAYLAEIVGPDGLVVTLDIDTEVATRAARFLTNAGYERVVVLTGDGADGAPNHAPFDRIVVTVEAADIPPAWWDQLTDDGIIVAPLRIGGMTRTVALTRAADDRDRLFSDDLQLCGFVPMQGAGTNTQGMVVLNDTADAHLTLRFDGGTADAFDTAGLATSLHGPRVEYWTGAEMGGSESFEHLDLWLVTTLAPILTLAPTRGAIDAGLVALALPFAAPTLVEGSSFAYRTVRATDDTDVYEIGVVAHGPSGHTVAARYTEQIAAWVAAQRPNNATVRLLRRRRDTLTRHVNAPGVRCQGDGATLPLAVSRTIQRPHTELTVSWQATTPADSSAASGRMPGRQR